MTTDISAALGQMGVSEEQADLLHVAAQFCREEWPPERARAMIEEERGYDPDLWRRIADLGWLGIALPEAHGGAGLGIGEVVPVAEQMGRTLMATPFLASTLAAQLLLMAGSAAQQARWLPRLASGELVGTLALGEPGDEMRALGENEEGGFLVSGTARLIEHAAAADLILLSVGSGANRRLAVLETATLPAGVLRRETLIDDTRRAFELTLRGFELPGAAVLRKEAAGPAVAHAELAGALLYAADMVGGAFRVIDYTADYLRTRKQFGKLIGSYQALKHPLVDAFIGYERARSHLYAAAHSFGDQERGEVAVRMAKAQAETAYAYAADRAIQFHGGFGFTYDCDAGLHRRRALYDASRFGDARTHRKRIADMLF
ncbi:acyl-CoA dehydrogenase family protein [Pacificimonas flava]|uniref:Butyryl-CoA dehydrogenase n=1 Tax=Pacificimonas flava TaxID=1234595 RepID=M2U600_9SPHN|nr:acyl-CoA dehydrogenase family protein [Pacificimonas flava]EMD83428.1 Butyryl-CoA dehydrogenase [Pacificimonas flava]MBB5279011.1 alkylation response protein AidB-like acyl-CoA dehydrogenase [Pacificimonas flava]